MITIRRFDPPPPLHLFFLSRYIGKLTDGEGWAVHIVGCDGRSRAVGAALETHYCNNHTSGGIGSLLRKYQNFGF